MTRAGVDHGMAKGVEKERDKVAVKVTHEGAGIVARLVMLPQNAVSLVDCNKYKMVINPALLLPLPEPSSQLRPQLQPLLNLRFAESTSST